MAEAAADKLLLLKSYGAYGENGFRTPYEPYPTYAVQPTGGLNEEEE